MNKMIVNSMTDYELSRRKKTKKGYFWPKKGENEFFSGHCVNTKSVVIGLN